MEISNEMLGNALRGVGTKTKNLVNTATIISINKYDDLYALALMRGGRDLLVYEMVVAIANAFERNVDEFDFDEMSYEDCVIMFVEDVIKFEKSRLNSVPLAC